MKVAVGIAVALVLLVGAAFLPLPIRPYLDFQVIYHADMGLVRGIPVYDHAGQVDMIAQLASVTPEQVFVIPFPYPPWYALVTIWLVYLPIDLAARVWFGLNLLMLCVSLWLLTEGLPRLPRGVISLLGILFPPVLGSLFVGQYVFPVLLGASLLCWSLRHKNAAPAAIAAALLTFKPHLGALVLMLLVIFLWLRRDEFGRRALLAMVLAAALLFGLGFLASPAWPIAYFHSLTGFQGVSQCHQCTNLPMALVGLAGGGFNLAFPVAAALLALLGWWLIRNWGRLAERPRWLIAAGLLVTLLASPYLQNYDYVVLLVPLVVLSGETQGVDWIFLALAYVLPVIGLGLFGSAGSLSLVISGLVLLIQMMRAAGRRGGDYAARPLPAAG